MNYRAYAINLKRSPDRWEQTLTTLQPLQIPCVRIEAIAGEQLPGKPAGYNRLKYNLAHGKTTNPREIGCYFSHILALRTFLESGDEYGLILEDDVSLPANLPVLIAASIPYSAFWDVLRLSAHKPGHHLPFAILPDGYELSYNTQVLKNTGAYLVNRHAAQCITTRMLPMFLPYDVALDREWHYGFKTACISPIPVQLNNRLPSQIPSVKKIRALRTTTFHLFHLITHIERRIYRTRYFRAAKTATF